MPKATSLTDNTRLSFFKNDLGKKPELQKAFEKLYNDKKGDWTAIQKALQKDKKFGAEMVNNLAFTQELASWTGDNKTIVTLFQNNKETNSLRDIALNINRKDFKKIIASAAIPKGETKTAYADKLFNGLYEMEPTALIINFLRDPAIPLLNNETGAYISSLLLMYPEFNIKTTSVYDLIKKKETFKGLTADEKYLATKELKTLQRITSISPVPEAIPALMNKNYGSAYSITQLPPNQFIATLKDSDLSEETLAYIYTQAEKKKIYYEHVLISVKEAGEKTGIKIIDGDVPVRKDRNNPGKIDPDVEDLLAKNNLSWDLLFGDADYCECDECSSLYSAASYYVDLLQYLRNNNIDPDYERKGPLDITGTPLEGLFARRPDLGHLELTCKNTNTVLPYVDLVNEVMEQYIAFKIKSEDFKDYTGFNVNNETSGELLSAPQHTEQEAAYQTLQTAMFPFSLPYHQPIDAARIFLNRLNSSRYELIDTFRSNNAGINYDKASDAEFLVLTEEEYSILTKESFNGVADIHNTDEYYGLKNITDWLEKLSDVKNEFLPRSGILYTELVELIKTEYINPGFSIAEYMVMLNSLSQNFYDAWDSYRGEMDTDWVTLFSANPDLKNLLDAYDADTLSQKLSDFFTAIRNCIVLYSPDNNCSLDEVKLIHYDNVTLTDNDFGKLHRFIRLWRKLGFTIDETDKAIMALGSGAITPELIHQLVALKKIMDRTGIEMTKLLCIWGDIGTAGENSLYQRLFLSHNLRAMDDVFEPDTQTGQYLPGTPKTIADHLPAVMAALNLSAANIASIKTFKSLPAQLTLTIENLSLLYRYRLLSKILGLRIPSFLKLLEVFGDVFEDSDTTIQFLQRLNKIEDAGFTVDQLSYIINGGDSNSKSFIPTKKEVIVLAKKLVDGQTSIESEHADLTPDNTATTDDEKLESVANKATSELVRSKASLLYETELAEKIISILEGTTLYNTSAPSLTSIPDFPVNLQKKVRYIKTIAPLTPLDTTTTTFSLQVTGALTTSELLQLNTSVTGSTAWAESVDDIEKQQTTLFNDLLSGIFTTNQSDADLIKSENNAASAPSKRGAFLRVFLPYLRDKLKIAHVVNVFSQYTGLDKTIVQTLVMNILKSDGFSLYDKLTSPTELPAPNATELSWHGKLMPVSDDNFTFIVRTTKDRSFKISLDNLIIIEQTGTQVIEAIELRSAEMKLETGKVYQLSLEGISLTDFYWKTSITSVEPIPSNSLLVDFKKKATRAALEQLGKMAILINGLSLSVDEIDYIHTNRADFSDIDFNDLSLEHLLRIIDYCDLRDSLPHTNLNLLQFWERMNESGTVLSDHIAQLTNWKKENIDMLISAAHFNLTKSNFRNEQNLIKLQNSLSVGSKMGMDINNLFEWAIPVSDYDACKIIANSIQNAIRAQYNQTDWEQVVKPLNDQLRNNQKNALIAYLLQQQGLKTANVTDANGLFEYFLIDVQMDPCMETSRIKQAISSVQLFIQRCFMGLEGDILPGLLSRDRWEWMGKYRVWEANRKVFLYPENWIESNLRDDKSPFFKELESELLQKDINKQNVTDALKTYLYKVDEVANMEVIGLYVEGSGEDDFVWEKGAKLHVFSRTLSAPYFFYYRYLALDEMNWSSWEKMQVDIPSYDVTDDNGHITGNGCYLTPVVWNNRLLVFFPQFTKKTKPNPRAIGNIQSLAGLDQSSLKPIEYWEIKMAWSEYRNGKWTQKSISNLSDKQSHQSKSVVDPKLREALEQAQSDVNIALKESSRLKIASDKAYELYNDAEPDTGKNSPGIIFRLRTSYNDKKKLYDESLIKLEAAKVKLVSAKEAITTSQNTSVEVIGDIFLFEFVPVISDDFLLLAIKCFYNNEDQELGIFEFNGNSLQVPVKTYSGNNSVKARYFHYSGLTIKYSSISSLQTSGTAGYVFQRADGYVNFNGSKFYHPYSQDLIGKLGSERLNELFNSIGLPDKADLFGAYNLDNNNTYPDSYHELKRPYSLYNWELFFHVPIMIADALSKAQQFEEAMKWFHYIFNPIAESNSDFRFWQFVPFKEIDSKSVLEKFFNELKANEPNAVINEWRNNPFKPHLVARSRPVAYMKWVVMKYIDNILDWGDYLFRQDTIESINQATQLYVLAGHILGPKPMMIPKRGEVKAQSYFSMLAKWDAASNAMTEMEVAAVYSIPTSQNPVSDIATTATADVFGSASTLYFCIPKNPKLLGYWDTLADRLFKIRHCQNIEGVFRKLPLFEPPIDPALLVKAAAQGLSISSVVNDLNSAMPNYRFYYLLQKALELCNELKSLGNAMLSAIEKKDNETISLIRARHEGTMNNLVMEIKKLQLEEAQKTIDSLYQNRKAPEAKMRYYMQLIGEKDQSKIPAIDVDFSELVNSIETPIDESGLRLSKFEKEEYDKSIAAHSWQLGASVVEALSAIFHAIPNAKVHASPLGVGGSVGYGGTNLGNSSNATAKVIQIISSQLSFEASNAAKKGGFQRALQERIFQANAAGYELKQIDKQITTQLIRINIANQEISNQLKQIDNSNEVEEFLKNKYTNEELYVWMRGSLKTLYHQVYNLAYDLAKKAERTYCFERGITNAGFIQSGYFDAGREGLLAGEQLYVGLKQLESAYQEKRGYDYEITKHVSLRQLDPLALIKLKATGKCEFDLPEVLFDMDFPGHFKRRIKSVSVSVPCIAGPYTGVNASLRLVNNKFRNSSIASNANNYPEKTDEQDERFISYNIPITSIATSSAQNDSGMFELNFKDERYLPFEGAGVISRWSLELPGVKQFDYYTISDVVLHIKYIASEGGEQLKESAKGSVYVQVNQINQQLNETGLHIPWSMKHDMPNEWNLFIKNGITNIIIEPSRLPYMAPVTTNATSLLLISRKKILRLRSDINPGIDINFNPIPGVDLFKSDEIIISIGSFFKLYGYKDGIIPSSVVTNNEVDNTDLLSLDDLVIVVKFILTS